MHALFSKSPFLSDNRSFQDTSLAKICASRPEILFISQVCSSETVFALLWGSIFLMYSYEVDVCIVFYFRFCVGIDAYWQILLSRLDWQRLNNDIRKWRSNEPQADTRTSLIGSFLLPS